MFTPENLIWISMVLPLIAVALIFLFGRSPNIREACTISVSIVLFVLVCQLAAPVFEGGRPEWILGNAFLEGTITETQLSILLGLFSDGIGKAALMPNSPMCVSRMKSTPKM